MNSKKKFFMVLLICLLAVSSVFAGGKKDNSSSSSSSSSNATSSASPSFRKMTGTIYGAYQYAGELRNNSSISTVQKRTYSQQYTITVSSSNGVSLPVIESQVGLQNGSSKTITAEVEVSLAPKQVVHWYVRPIIQETTVYLNNLKVGFASEVLTFDDKVED